MCSDCAGRIVSSTQSSVSQHGPPRLLPQAVSRRQERPRHCQPARRPLQRWSGSCKAGPFGKRCSVKYWAPLAASRFPL